MLLKVHVTKESSEHSEETVSSRMKSSNPSGAHLRSNNSIKAKLYVFEPSKKSGPCIDKMVLRLLGCK